MRYLFILLFLWQTKDSFCQKKKVNISSMGAAEKKCREFFLVKQITYSKIYSDYIIIPVIISGDKFRMKIKSEFLHKYLTVIEANNEKGINLDKLLDSITYLQKVLNIINYREKLIFNVGIFEVFVKNGGYLLLDKPNPYLREIKNAGLKYFVNKIFAKDKLVRGTNITYILIYKDQYEKVNEYGLNYLIEALFNYNFKFEKGDGTIGFTKIGCDPLF